MPISDRLKSAGLFFAAWFLIIASHGAYGAGTSALGEPVNAAEAKAGTLLVRAEDERVLRTVPMLGTEVDIQVTGVIARTVVTQYFHNPTDLWLEGVYVFPLPDNAAVDTLQVRIGDRVILGEIQEREQAKKTYEQAKAAGKKAALLEQERPNIFTTSVAGIPPESTIGVRIEYQRELLFRDGIFSLRFPMVVAPRYIPGDKATGASGTGFSADTDQVPDGSRITPVVSSPDKKPINPVKIKATINAGARVSSQSTSHAIGITETGSGALEIELANGSVPADRDFVLSWRPEVEQRPEIALFKERFENEDYALLMVMPPQAERITNQRIPREVIFILDKSGSMAGTSFEQATAALKLALKRLQPSDTFNVIAFSNESRMLFTSAMPATADHVQTAINGLDRLEAEGGTEMMPALELALTGQQESEKIRQVIFITDGAVGYEEPLFRYIEKHIGQSRLFTVGIGSAPNTHFMKRAAILGRGSATHIANFYEVNQEMTKLFRRLESPMLTDISVAFDGLSIESYPSPIPDLYAGEPIVVLFKGKDLAEGVTISGRIGSNAWQQRVPLAGSRDQPGIARLYARRKIDAIEMSFAELEKELHWQAAERKIKDDITATGLRYQLVTQYTSLVAVEQESSVPFDETLKTRPVPINLPAGWEPARAWEQPAAPALDPTASAMSSAMARISAPELVVEREEQLSRNRKVKAFHEKVILYERVGQPNLNSAGQELPVTVESATVTNSSPLVVAHASALAPAVTAPADKPADWCQRYPDAFECADAKTTQKATPTSAPMPSALQIAMSQILPRTATPAQLMLIMGSLLLLASLMLWQMQRGRCEKNV